MNQDTLRIEATFHVTDSTGILVSQTDTLEMLAKTSYAKRLKEKEKEFEKWQKEQEKRKKKEQSYDSIMPPKVLALKLSSSNMAPDQTLTMESTTPLRPIDTDHVHLYSRIDTLWYKKPFQLVPHEGSSRIYDVLAEWEAGTEYSFEIDSAAVSDIYDTRTAIIKHGLKIGSDDEYGTLAITLSGVRDTGLVVQLMNSSENIVKQSRLTQGSTVYFFYLRPGSYYMRAFIDANGNNLWDTGDYDHHRQAERLYYYPKQVEVKQKWDLKLDWSLNAKPVYEQKPQAITKQKPEQQKRLQNRNAQRAKELGKEYLKDKGVNL